jgi:hypothetical protein
LRANRWVRAHVRLGAAGAGDGRALKIQISCI